ncbi:unnamed protein product [Hydatigera taeniaeformis]|uniref:Transposase n=1 Tax=Hydatigena taeniaeformis TaxID=6205 RepID=A0A0R3X2Y0_HYDTA|nr:unnamed protein product [Hydatigera taeniaeformis]
MNVCGCKIDPSTVAVSPNVVCRVVSAVSETQVADVHPKGGMAYAAYRRHISSRNYNQYADDVTGTSSNPHGSQVIGGYMDYFNQTPEAVQSGFGPSATLDDELIADGQHRVGDTELLTS